MPLPIIQHPIYEVYLKSLDKNIKFRPFLVKEEKIMLIAKESEDDASLINAIKQVIQNCCIDQIDVDTLPIFDVQMFFTHLRMKSIGEIIELNFTCEKLVPGTEEVCNLVNTYELKLEKIKYDETIGHSDDIKLTNEVGIKLKYPALTKIEELYQNSSNPLEVSLNLIADNVVYLYDKDQVYDNTQFNKQELMDFLSNLTQDYLDKILSFFATTPRVVLRDTANCKKCGQEHAIYAENVSHFFI